MNTRRAGFVAVILAACIALVGCGSNNAIAGSAGTPATPSGTPASLAGTPAQRAALDKVITESSAQLPKMKSMFAGVYGNITFSAQYPSTLVITYTFVKQVDPVAAKPRFASQGPVLAATCKTDFFPEMASAGVPHPAGRFVWLNPDGTQVATYNCSSQAK